jgi:hypothetical protein
MKHPSWEMSPAAGCTPGDTACEHAAKRTARQGRILRVHPTNGARRDARRFTY